MNIKLKRLILDAESKMNELAEYGAADSEPNKQLQLAMVVALNSGRTDLPSNGREWELYVNTYGLAQCNKVADELNRAVMPLVEFIADNRTSTRIQNDVREYCWRI